MPTSLEYELVELKGKLTSLPEATEPPPTTLQIIRRYQQEQDWQRLLMFFLTPDRPHGLETDLLEHFLTSLSGRDDLDFSYSRHALSDVQVAQEVTLSNGGIPDAVLWSAEDWFICLELKVGAVEGSDQTISYVDAESFQSIGLDKAAVPTNDHYYIYLAPDDSQPPAADEFVHVSWTWVATVLQSFIEDSRGAYPARTTAQIQDFIDTIRSELTMTEYEENEAEKAELYFQYYDEIADVQRAFEKQWKTFTENWGTRLARSLDGGVIVEDPARPDGHVVVELEGSIGDRERWVFLQGGSDWAGITLDRWRRDRDDPSRTYPDEETAVHLTLFHRLELNRDLAIRDQTLELKLWHGASNGDEFVECFSERFAAIEADEGVTFPSTVDITGGNRSVFVAEYDIPVGEHGNFYDAYVAALRTAFLDLFVENASLFTAIDESFEACLNIYR